MSKANFKDLINQNKPVLVDFSAEWCSPCKMQAPILEIVKKNIGDKASIIKIDIDKNSKLAESLQVRSVPTLILFRQGQILWRQSGVAQAAQLTAIISAHVNES